MAVGMLGRYEEALALYKQVVKPQQAHYNLAVVCEARQDTKRATAEFAIARSIGAPFCFEGGILAEPSYAEHPPARSCPRRGA